MAPEPNAESAGITTTSTLPKDLQKHRSDLEAAIAKGKYTCSRDLAIMTVKYIEEIISSHSWKTASELILWLRETTTIMARAALSESTPANIIQRLIKTVQEDFAEHKLPKPTSVLAHLHLEDEIIDYNVEVPELRPGLQIALNDLMSDIEASEEYIADEAPKHIHTNEVVLTLGKSRTVEKFLKKAAKKSVFEVIISECTPYRHGHDLAISLAKSKIHTTLIPDSSVFAMMSRVNKVVIGTHSVLGNGGLKAVAGTHLIALAAKHYNVPVIVLTPLYKLSPEYPRSADVKIRNRFVGPDTLVDYSDGGSLGETQIINPVFDYVPPDLISLFIFNIGSHAPSYIYRLLHETYPLLNEPTQYQ